jgi:hypothetical protein
MAIKSLSKEDLIKNQETDAYSLDPAQFCRLLLSRRHLVRAHEISASANVVIDSVTGNRYHVDASRFDQFLEQLAG